ncbi:MAG: thioesterase [Phenylobacterium zucineum]|nr:MAG: thioesterase [Phenylobacterium zucineum]
MSDIPPDSPIASRMANATPQALALGFETLSMTAGRASMKVPWREDLVETTDSRALASGVMTTLMDHCCGMAVAAIEEDRFPTATLDLRIDFLRPAAPGAGVMVEAHCYKSTDSLAFVRATAWDDRPQDPIATVQAAFVLNGPQSARPAS